MDSQDKFNLPKVYNKANSFSICLSDLNDEEFTGEQRIHRNFDM